MNKRNGLLFCFVALMLVFAFVLTPSCIVKAEESDDPQTYYGPIILEMIEENLETGNTDEEFFNAIADVYLADPVLFLKLLENFDTEEIQFLIKAIAYNLQKTERSDQAGLLENDDPEINRMIQLIYRESINSGNATLDALEGIIEPSIDMLVQTSDAVLDIPPDGDMLNVGDLILRAPVPSNSTGNINTTTTVSVTFGTMVGSSSIRSYTINLYKMWYDPDFNTNILSQVASKNVILPAFNTTVSASIPIVYNKVGEYTLFYEVCDNSGNCLGTSSNSDTVTIYGQWRIEIELPENRNYKGELTLISANGRIEHSCICLGRAESNAAPNIIEGNTPTGVCTGELGGPVGEDEEYSYGPYMFIRLYPISGNIKNYTNRSGFLIHGGDPAPDENATWYPLRPTHGCIRVTNADQWQLQFDIMALINKYHEEKGIVIITES